MGSVTPANREPGTPIVRTADDGEVHVTASARLRDIATDSIVASFYPLLAEACAQGDAHGDDASLADSLAPATSCRTAADGVACAVTAGSVCAAMDPSTALHSIIDGGPCWRACTSMTGVALHALDAQIEFGAGAQREVVERIRLPADAANGFQRLFRAPQEHAPSLAGICVAAVRRTDGDVRLVLGGVSPRPYRVYTSVEEEAMAGGLDEDAIAGLAERALLDAEAEPENADTFDAAAALLRRAIAEIAAISP
ncbi:hypothetical protein BH11GEM2_BH11GEM2_19140 [soil metagenome]